MILSYVTIQIFKHLLGIGYLTYNLLNSGNISEKSLFSLSSNSLDDVFQKKLSLLFINDNQLFTIEFAKECKCDGKLLPENSHSTQNTENIFSVDSSSCTKLCSHLNSNSTSLLRPWHLVFLGGDLLLFFKQQERRGVMYRSFYTLINTYLSQ